MPTDLAELMDTARRAMSMSGMAFGIPEAGLPQPAAPRPEADRSPPQPAAPPPEADRSPPQPTAAPPSRLDQIEKLADLRDRGVLTDEEFAAAKAKLLGR